MKDKKWLKLHSEYLIKNKWITVRKDCVRQSNGFEVDDYYVLEYPDWVTVIAITEDNRFVLERQYRHGSQQTCLELCGGTIEKDEQPLKLQNENCWKKQGLQVVYGHNMH